MPRIPFSICAALLIGVFLMSGCESRNSAAPKKPWKEIVKKLEVILQTSEADSIKSQKIKAVFESYQLGIGEYRRFYEVYSTRNPGRNITLLQNIETEITEEMKKATQEYRKIKEEERRQDALEKLKNEQKEPPSR